MFSVIHSKYSKYVIKRILFKLRKCRKRIFSYEGKKICKNKNSFRKIFEKTEQNRNEREAKCLYEQKKTLISMHEYKSSAYSVSFLVCVCECIFDAVVYAAKEIIQA